MSWNFELLRLAGQELLSGAAAVEPAIARPTNAKSSSLGLEAMTREEVLKLVQRIFLTGGSSAPRQVVFCGVDESRGSSWVCARASQSLAAQVSAPVCVVDANWRAPALSQLLGTNGPGAAPLPKAGSKSGLHGISENLWLVSADGTGANRNGAPSLEELRARISELRTQFEFVLIDAPPIGLYSDAAVLGHLADGIVLVVEAHATRRAAALKAKEVLEAAHVRLLGTVLNNRTFPMPEKIYRRL